MSKLSLYIPCHFNEKDAEKIGINGGDFTEFVKKSETLYWEMENAGIVTSSFKEAFELFRDVHVEYETPEAYAAHGNYLLVTEKNFFVRTLTGMEHVDISNAWLTFLRHISEDIDILEERYSDTETAAFLRSMLIYFSAYTVTTEI